jgi:membrane-associated protease RseP (regulator of RpoE activity)
VPYDPTFPAAFEPAQFAPPVLAGEIDYTRRLWLHILLLIATLFSTTLVGAHMQYNFAHNLPFFDVEHFSRIFSIGLESPAAFASGLPFSLTLLAILMAHEMGHFLACVYYGVDATLPFFLPSPMPVTGTFGAFIRIKSPIYSKRVLFDIGIAGPLAGFIFLIPALGAGLAFSKVMPGIGHQGSIELGVPALQWLAEKLIFPGTPTADIYLHPVARAAWVGMFATALNLLPVGQLDGGHIVYALFGPAHRFVTNVFLAILATNGAMAVVSAYTGSTKLQGFLWNGWLFWSVLLFFFARRHPPLYDHGYIGQGRAQLGAVALIVFLLCFSLVPMNA